MPTTHIELTLQQLLRIALGCPKVSRINLSLLQSFFDILLMKLDCRNEKVEIAGTMSTCLQKILRQSRISPYPFDCIKIESLSETIAKAAQLRERVGFLETKVSEHLMQTQRQNDVLNTHYRSDNWEQFSEPTESLCKFPESDDLFSCKLLQNRHFVLNLISRAVTPLLNEMNEMRKRLKALHAEVLKFKTRFNSKLSEMDEIHKHCIIAEKLRKDFEKDLQTFNNTAIEIQNMMLAKSERTELLLIKKWFINEMEIIKEKLKNLDVPPDCVKAEKRKQTISESQCLSCLGASDCLKVTALAQPREECIEKKEKERAARYCSLNGPCLSDNMKTSLAREMQLGEQDKFEIEKLCEPFPLLRGYNGEYYRKASNEDCNIKLFKK